jgi:hypothetical protein
MGVMPPAWRTRRAGLTLALALLVLLAACSGGGRGRQVGTTPFVAGRFDPRQVATVPTPVAGETNAARAAAGNALQSLAGPSGGPLQVLNPSVLSGASVVDVLRVSAGAGIAPDEARTRLPALGWRWLVTWSAVEAHSGVYREWRVDVLAFASSGGAGRYVADPFLEPALLQQSGKQQAPDAAASGAALYRAADAVAPLLPPATPGPGERAALIWRRGRIVAAVSEAQTPAGLDLGLLAALSRNLDAGLVQVPGSVDQ